MILSLLRVTGAIVVLTWLSGCAPLLGVVGGIGEPIMQLATLFDRAKLISDGVSYAKSGKSTTDHALSFASGADCRMFNVLSGEPVCYPNFVATPADPHEMISAAAGAGLALFPEQSAARGVTEEQPTAPVGADVVALALDAAGEAVVERPAAVPDPAAVTQP